MACLFARGHLLIEDVPGVGKTLLAQAIARVLGLSFSRIQFTSDMLPADVIGTSVFDRDTSTFRFHRGPVFAHVVLADEVNRATPKAQSALLEAMEEQQVTTDGETHTLPTPFFVIATQNPATQIGTFPLPESQLDRFLMCMHLGYPAPELERKLLAGEDRRLLLSELQPVLDTERLASLQSAVPSIYVADALLDYTQALVARTRESAEIELGLSPRGAVDLISAARAWALFQGHAGVQPEDLQAVFEPVAGHRLRARDAAQTPQESLVRHVLESVPVP